jgi:hypothetical protein
MSFQDEYQLPEMIVTPEGIDPTKAITYDQENDVEAAKKKIAAELAKRIAEEEDQSGVRSQLRDVFNSDSEMGLGSEAAPPPPSTLRLTVTPGDLTNVSSGPAYGPPADLTQDQPPNLEGTIPDLTGVFGVPSTEPVQPPQSQDLTTFVDQATRSPRQMISGALGTIGSLPWMAGAAMNAPAAIVERLTGNDNGAASKAVDWFLGRAGANQRFGENVMGLSGADAEPRNPVEAVSKIIGESATPMKGASLLATGIVSGGNCFHSLFVLVKRRPMQRKQKKQSGALMLFKQLSKPLAGQQKSAAKNSTHLGE